MNEDLNTALMLMGVGMITVFVVLSLVVLVGNLLTTFVNRYIPEVQSAMSANQEVDPHHVVAISAAVEAATGGKGRVTSIEKI